MMNLVFISGYFNHHQRFLSDALAARCSYTFISTTPYNRKRLALGWTPEKEPDYVCHYDAQPERAEELLKNADLVITGGAPEKLVRRCIRRGQLVMRYSERPLKKGLQWKKYLPRLIKWHSQNPPWRKVYLLCASAYTAGDYGRFGLFRGKAFRWGYFPEQKQYASGEELLSKKKKATILWAGRFLELKHPDDAIGLAARLKAAGYDFRLDIIGSGEMESQLREMIAREQLADRVRMLGAMKPEQVRAHMEEAEIFLFTSDRREGWGVVLNEAMNSGCCVVADHAIGSAPFLVQSGENGLLYRSGDTDDLYHKVASLLDDPKRRQKLGLRAYETVTREWNPETAACRLLELAKGLLEGKKATPFPQGPCSKAEELREDWFKG